MGRKRKAGTSTDGNKTIKKRQLVLNKSSSDDEYLSSSTTLSTWSPDHATPHQEYQYLDLIRYIIENGEQRNDRTGTGTCAVFAPNQLRFNLADDVFPLLTTKRVFFRAVVEELLWFVRGDTDAQHLSEKGINIWDENGSREYLDKIGLNHREEGDLGPVYGFQWRHFGAEYIDCKTDYTGKGVDQLKDIINKIKTDPTNRRIVMSAWNPKGIYLRRQTNHCHYTHTF